MRLDSKYFTPFLATVTIVSMAIILYATISWLNKQQETMLENVSSLQPSEIRFGSLQGDKEVYPSDYAGRPVIIHFWATWSGRSEAVGTALAEMAERHEDLVVIAASVRDHPELAREWTQEQTAPFEWVEGTELYQTLQIPGVPSQLLIGRNGEFATLHVGDNLRSLQQEIEELVRHE